MTINESIIYGEIASITCRERIHVMWIDNEWNGLVSMMRFMDKVERGHYMVPSRREPEILGARLLGVTLIQYRDLLRKFGSLARMSCATEKELKTIYGIGESKARRILNILHGKE